MENNVVAPLSPKQMPKALYPIKTFALLSLPAKQHVLHHLKRGMVPWLCDMEPSSVGCNSSATALAL